MPRALRRPEKGKATARHEMRQLSKGQTAESGLSDHREQECLVWAGAALTIAG